MRAVLGIAIVLATSISGCTWGEVSAGEPGGSASRSPLPAADGTDLNACRDADCEVEVRKNDQLTLDAGWPVATMEVEYLSEEKITLKLEGLSGAGPFEGLEPYPSHFGEGFVTVTSRRPRRVSKIQLSMIAGDSVRAVLVLRPAT